MGKYTHVLREAMTHVVTDPHKTVAMLDAGIAQAISSGDRLEAARLAKHAGAVAGGNAERRYLELAVQHDPLDAMGLIALGGCLERDGEIDAAADFYRRALSLAVEKGDGNDIDFARHCLAKITTGIGES